MTIYKKDISSIRAMLVTQSKNNLFQNPNSVFKILITKNG